MTFDQSTDKCRRGSLSMAWTVEIGCGIGNIKDAAKYLASCNVPLEVTRRVLLTPHLRRAVKW